MHHPRAITGPGYGHAPLATEASPERFAHVVAELCDRPGIDRLTAVVDQSAGGPTAVTLASRHPDLIEPAGTLASVNRSGLDEP